MEFLQDSQRVFEIIAATTAVVSVVFAIIAALRSGVIRSLRIGSIEIEGSITGADIKSLEGISETDQRPFEAKALASYYNQALSRANISFWFSLIFASIGFGVIIFAFFLTIPLI